MASKKKGNEWQLGQACHARSQANTSMEFDYKPGFSFHLPEYEPHTTSSVLLLLRLCLSSSVDGDRQQASSPSPLVPVEQQPTVSTFRRRPQQPQSQSSVLCSSRPLQLAPATFRRHRHSAAVRRRQPEPPLTRMLSAAACPSHRRPGLHLHPVKVIGRRWKQQLNSMNFTWNSYLWSFSYLVNVSNLCC